MTREEAIKAIDHLMYSSPHESTEGVVKKKYYAELLKDYIANTVEVVHCKDCKHYQSSWIGLCDLIGDNITRTPDDYCSRGERKTE